MNQIKFMSIFLDFLVIYLMFTHKKLDSGWLQFDSLTSNKYEKFAAPMQFLSIEITNFSLIHV